RGQTEPIPEKSREYPLIKTLIKETLPGNGRKLVDAMDIKYPGYVMTGSQAEALSAAHIVGFPVALKIASPDILHKSDVGGVRLHISNTAELSLAYNEIIGAVKAHMPDARITGVVVEEMVPPGIEVIIGAIRDPHFGPVVMFGLGGIFTETIKDTVYDIAPITHNCAVRMIESIRGYDILKGIRGTKGADIETIADTIVKVSEVITLFPEIEEIEFNPAVAYPGGIVVVDVKIIHK
ncbi:MAG: acetate--CoA ligase family protein, partial [Nitrospirota bacterium]